MGNVRRQDEKMKIGRKNVNHWTVMLQLVHFELMEWVMRFVNPCTEIGWLHEMKSSTGRFGQIVSN